MIFIFKMIRRKELLKSILFEIELRLLSLFKQKNFNGDLRFNTSCYIKLCEKLNHLNNPI